MKVSPPAFLITPIIKGTRPVSPADMMQFPLKKILTYSPPNDKRYNPQGLSKSRAVLGAGWSLF